MGVSRRAHLDDAVVGGTVSADQTIPGVAALAGDLLTVRAISTKAFAAVPVTGVTFNGVAMTKADDYIGVGGGADWIEESIWYIVVGSDTTGDVVVSTGTGVQFHCSIDAWVGYDSAGPFGGDVNFQSNATPTSTLTLTVNPGDMVIDVIYTMPFNNTGLVAGGDQTVDFSGHQTDFDYSGFSHILADAASEAVSWTGSGDRAHLAIVIVQDGGGGGSDVLDIDDYHGMNGGFDSYSGNMGG